MLRNTLSDPTGTSATVALATISAASMGICESGYQAPDRCFELRLCGRDSRRRTGGRVEPTCCLHEVGLGDDGVAPIHALRLVARQLSYAPCPTRVLLDPCAPLPDAVSIYYWTYPSRHAG